ERLGEHPLARGHRRGRWMGREPFGREQRRAPGAKVLRGEAVARDPAQVRVDLARVDALLRARFVDVLEELAAGQVHAALHDAREAPIAHDDFLPLAALAAEAEAQRGAFDAYVAV